MPTRRGPQVLTDESLVTLVAAGDEGAFEEIFDRYAATLLGFCVQMLGSRDWAEDALQLTFVAAYRALRRGACDGALRPWLYAIARNRCLSELRTRREFPDSDRVNADRPAIDGPASVVARRERLRELVDDIQRLPEDQRAAVVLFELAGQSHEEIATVLGVRREKVKALIFQARQGLQRGRSARDSACSDVRHRLSNAVEKVPARGSIRAHIERCAPCQEFEREVSRQRAAFAFFLPVVVTGAIKSSVLSAVLGRGGAGLGAGSSAGGVGSASGGGALTSMSGGAATSGGAMSVAGAGAATAAGGSAATATGGGALTAAAGGAGPTVVASALGGEAVAGAGVLTSSISIASVAKLATAVVVAVGVGGVTRSAFAPSPRAQAAIPVAQRSVPAPRTPLQPLASGTADPLLSRGGINSHSPLSPAAMGASGAGPSNRAQNAAGGGTSSPNPAAGGAPNSPGTGGSAPGTGPGSPPNSGPGGGGVTPASPPSGSFSPPGGPTTNTNSGVNSAGTSGGSTGGATAPPPPPPVSSPSRGNGRASGGGGDGSGSGGTASASPGGSNSAGSGGNGGSGSGPASSGQGPSSSSNAGGGDGAHGGGPPSTPPGCVGNSSPGCLKKGSH